MLPNFLSDMADDGQPEPRFQIMLIILVISLLGELRPIVENISPTVLFKAVSFPGLSESVPFLKIPHIVFFIGKHFGTGASSLSILFTTT